MPPGYDVAIYAPWIGPLLGASAELPPGGAERQIYILARGLAARDVRVSLITYETDSGLPAWVDGVRIVGRPPWKIDRGYAGKLLEAARSWRALWAVDAATYVQRVAGPATGIVALSAKLRRRRFVYSTATFTEFDFARADPVRRRVALFRLGVRLADSVVVQSEEQARLCRERFGRIPVVIKSIAEPAVERSAPGDAFLWVGRLAHAKNPLAFVDLARTLPDVPFRMVGVASPAEGPTLAAAVVEAAHDLPNLELLPPQPRDELLSLMDRAVAVVNTSGFEGMPNVFLEAWARGVPAVALSHDPDGVIGREELGSFAGGSPDHLARVVDELWAGRGEQDALAARCRDYVQREHSQEIVVDRWIEVLGLRDPAGET